MNDLARSPLSTAQNRRGLTPEMAELSLQRQAQAQLAQWYFQRFSPEDVIDLSKENLATEERMQIIQAFKELGTDAIGLWVRFKDLEEYEKETLTDLRDAGITVPEMIDYLRASSGFNPEGRPVRHEVATQLRQREFREKSQKIEARSRTGFAIAAALGTVAVGSWMVLSGDVTLGSSLPPVVAQPLAWAVEGLGGLMKNLLMGGALVGGWKAWKAVQEIKSGTPKLNMGKDEDFKDLRGPVGSPDYARLNAQYESITMTDQHLIKHFSPTELRFFLLGGDQTRLHLLRANPPSQRALMESAVEGMGHVSTWKEHAAVAWMLVSAPFRKERNDARIPDLADRMASWRRNAEMNRQAQENPEHGRIGPVI